MLLIRVFIPDLCTSEESFGIVFAVVGFVCGILMFVEVLRLVHFLLRHAFFFTPAPPKHFMSVHSGHVPQFGWLHPLHSPQRPRERFRLNLPIIRCNTKLLGMCMFMTISDLRVHVVNCFSLWVGWLAF